MAESLQQLILDHLDTHPSLPDSRTLTLPGATAPATDADSQITILGALNSLLSREVGIRIYLPPVIPRFTPTDDPLRTP
jgi:phenylalanyl-tRNA synthetase alpha chain